MAKSQHATGYKVALKLLREMREEAGLTQREMAEKCRKPQPWVHKSETGERRMDIHEFLLWCKACEVDPDQAFRRFVGMK